MVPDDDDDDDEDLAFRTGKAGTATLRAHGRFDS
jgi:hypothetical protein